jgi:Sel1 repeat
MARTSTTKAARRPPSTPAQSTAVSRRWQSLHVLWLPLAATVAFASFAWLPRVRSSNALLMSFVGTSIVLAVWWAVLRLRARGRALRVDVVVRPEHYMQLFAQLAIYVYWSFYWDPIRDAAWLIAAQVVFAYALDMMLTWSRRETYTLTFVPFPIVFSINLFLRFRDDYFAWQFVLVAIAFLAKEFIRWHKEGRRVHIFNPSSFALAIVSIVLLVTGTTNLTWGEGIATLLFLPPKIYLFLFLISLPAQFRFGITTMSLSAIVTTYVVGLAYFGLTGTYFFVDSYIPVAVFLGMLLLVTDPATAPRTELGRVMFGALYGVSTVLLYWVLGAVGAPTFYDKLLQIPLLNLSVQMLDRVARSPRMAWLDPARIGASLKPVRRRLAYTSLWVVIFTGMSFAQGIGDHHPGHSLKFWQQGCDQDRHNACRVETSVLTRFCDDGSSWSCNELGMLRFQRRGGSPGQAKDAFTQACRLGLTVGCGNASRVGHADGAPKSSPPAVADFAIMLREGKGELPDRTPFELVTRACNQDWVVGCHYLGELYLEGSGTSQNKSMAASMFGKACTGGVAGACSDLGYMYKVGDGIDRDQNRALTYLKKACDLGMAQACRWLREEQAPASARS